MFLIYGLYRKLILRYNSTFRCLFIIGSFDQAICIAPLDLLGAGISAHGEASTCKQAFDSCHPRSDSVAKVLLFSVVSVCVSVCLNSPGSTHRPTASLRALRGRVLPCTMSHVSVERCGHFEIIKQTSDEIAQQTKYGTSHNSLCHVYYPTQYSCFISFFKSPPVRR